MSINPAQLEAARAGWMKRDRRPPWQEPTAPEPAPTPAPSPGQRRCETAARLDEIERELGELKRQIHDLRRGVKKTDEANAIRFMKLGVE